MEGKTIALVSLIIFVLLFGMKVYDLYLSHKIKKQNEILIEKL